MSVLVVSVILVFVCFYIIVSFPSDVFCSSYQSVIQTKYNKLVNTKGPKIILVGGSNLAFGINEKLLEEKTGYKVANLGLHAGFGGLFNTELSKANINVGDIVLLAYEYGWYTDSYFDSVGVDLVMSGIDNHIEMYCWIPIRNIPEILGYLFQYAERKRTYKPASGVYSREAFDSEGRMIFSRETYIIDDYEDQVEHYGYVDLAEATISEHSINYLKTYKQYAEQRGAKVYFVASPLLALANRNTEGQLCIYAKESEEKTGIPYISNPNDYVFSKDLMYDTIYHCNNAGELYRTELLINDLQPYINKR